MCSVTVKAVLVGCDGFSWNFIPLFSNLSGLTKPLAFFPGRAFGYLFKVAYARSGRSFRLKSFLEWIVRLRFGAYVNNWPPLKTSSSR